jgi:aminopeptidase N
MFGRFILRYFLFVPFLATLSVFAQKSEALLNFYELEQQTWRQHIAGLQDAVLQTNFDVTFYHLDVEINITTPYIQGNVLCRFRAAENALQSIKLNLHHALAIDSITGNAANYITANDSIYITLDHPFQTGDSGEVQIFYRGIPELARGLKGLRYTTHAGDQPIIATLSTPFLAHYWWPCKDGPGDKPDSVFIDITIPDTLVNGIPLTATSNGVLENIILTGGEKTFQWRERYPIPPYYVMAAISNYQHFQQTYSGSQGENFPIDYYVFNEHLSQAQAGVAQLPEAMRVFSDYFGTYPFHSEKYGMTQLGFYGAIENQTNTIINNMSLSWFDVSVHELAHMWFGDMITCESWNHGWLNEGFATYCEALWAEHLGGFAAYKTNMQYNEFFGGGTLYLQDDSDPFNIFIAIIYSKGAYTLHMLRGVLGDSLFFNCLSEYTNNPLFRYDHATTEDFQNVCESVSGIDLDFFFEQWVYDEYYPNYEYSLSQNDSTFQATVTIHQTQGNSGRRPVFEIPVQLFFKFIDGSDTLLSVWNNQQQQSYEFGFTKKVSFISLDPDKWILRTTQQVAVTAENQPGMPARFELLQNYPNPFNPETAIGYQLSAVSNVELSIYNLLGQKVRTLVKQRQPAGYYEVKWDGRDRFGNEASSGIYIYQIQAGEYVKLRKIVLLR